MRIISWSFRSWGSQGPLLLCLIATKLLIFLFSTQNLFPLSVFGFIDSRQRYCGPVRSKGKYQSQSLRLRPLGTIGPSPNDGILLSRSSRRTSRGVEAVLRIVGKTASASSPGYRYSFRKDARTTADLRLSNGCIWSWGCCHVSNK